MSLLAIKVERYSSAKAWPSSSVIYFPVNCTHNTKAYNATAYFVNRQNQSSYYFWDGIGSVPARRQDGADIYPNFGKVYANTAYSGSLSPTTLKLDDLAGRELYNAGTDGSKACKIGSEPINLWTATANSGNGGSAEILSAAGDFVVDNVRYYPPGTSVVFNATPYRYRGYEFVSWSDGNTNATRSVILTSDTVLTATFAYRPQYDVEFNKNSDAATGAMSSQHFNYGDNKKLTKCSFSRSGYAFAGWATSANGSVEYADEEKVTGLSDTHNETITLYAVWVAVKLRKRGTGADGNENLDSVGTLVVRSSEDGYDAAVPLVETTETIGDESRKAWLFAPKPNTSYRVSCTLGTGDPDKFWAFSGITSNDQSLIDSSGNIVIGATLENEVANANFTRKVVKTVTTGTQAEAGSINPSEIAGATLAITTPAAPDVIAPGQTEPYGYGDYLTGQAITATAMIPDGVLGWELKNARLQVGGVTDDPVPNYIHEDHIDIPAYVFTDSLHIIGVFGRIDCVVDAKADVPSASVVSGVAVKKYSSLDEDWVNATSAKYGETVRVYATVDTSRGHALDGIYANGSKIASSIPNSGYVEYVVQGETHFVVKVKVNVALGIGHWDVAGNAWTMGECSVTASVSGAEVEHPEDGFDVILGQSVAYEVNIQSGWNFDAWFEGTEDSLPTEFDEPVALPISNTEFVPTDPVAVIARVTNAVITYTTKVGFANNDNPSSVVDIQAETANVTSFPAADGTEVSENKVVLTYSSGTKPATLTFAENIGNLYFEKLQEYVRHAWSDIQIEGTAYPMLTSKNRELRALYTTAGERTVTIAYANIPNVDVPERVCGEIRIVESNYPAENPDGKTFVADRGTPFTLRAVPKNGWRFAGWYYNPAHIGVPKYDGTEVSVSVISTRTLYAYFEPDTHAVYEWEGRNENKMMTWRSKVYVSPTPFNPSAIRVDATDSRGRGTSVARAEVGMMSSPDAVPAQSGITVLTNMPNYVARRLPKRRPERYMYVEVQNDAEVDRIIVGTSMEGLRV